MVQLFWGSGLGFKVSGFREKGRCLDFRFLGIQLLELSLWGRRQGRIQFEVLPKTSSPFIDLSKTVLLLKGNSKKVPHDFLTFERASSIASQCQTSKC